MSARIVLASSSQIRRSVLAGAGIDAQTESPGVDEDAIKRTMADAPAEDVARALAEAKARAVSLDQPESWVIGADQVLRLEGKLYDKVDTMEAARKRLLNLRGMPHELVAGIALAHGGEIRRAQVSVTRMQVREFSKTWLDGYLEHAGEAILSSVGCYHYEGLGVQLFDRVDGDYYSILGLPLLPLLAMLREEGVIET
ncbi:MAG: Maf family protein [Maricaulaceae bacterium]